MAYVDITRNMMDGAIVISDGTTTAREVAITCDEGNLKISASKERHIIYNRGVMAQVKEGKELPVDVSFGIKFSEFITNEAASLTPFEILMRAGDAAVGGAIECTSTRTDAGEAYCVNLEFTITNPDAATAEHDELIVVEDFFVEKCDFSEGEEYNSLVVSGKGLCTLPTITKV